MSQPYPPPGYQQQPGFQHPQGFQQQGFQQQPAGPPPKKKPSAGQRVVGILILVVALLAFFLVIDKDFRNNVLDAVGLKDGIGGGSGSSAAWTSATKRPRTDAQMITDAKKFADALTQGH